MELAEPLRPVLAVLQRTYPGGVPQQDYRPILIVLGDVLCEENLGLVVAEFIDGEAMVVAHDAAAAHDIDPPSRQERARVRAALEAHGLAGLYDGEDTDA